MLCNDVLHVIASKLPLNDISMLECVNKTLYNTLSKLYHEERKGKIINISQKYVSYECIENYENAVIENNKRRISNYLRYNLNWYISKYHHNRVLYDSRGLTSEQKKIVSFVPYKGQTVLIQAFAGTGKTSTLFEVAKQSNQKILYLAFNKELCSHAEQKFGDLKNVTVCTIHALAYERFPKCTKKLTIAVIENALEISKNDAITVKRILNTFAASSSKFFIGDSYFSELAKNLYKKICRGEVPCTHDLYLKMFQLSSPVLGYDIILLDEVQDATPCILDIINSQTSSTKYFVGDIHQQIYSFRNVCNPYILLSDYKKFTLSCSFRFGFEVAHLSSIFLSSYKQERLRIRSNVKETKLVQQFQAHESYTYICRSNLTLLCHAFMLAREGNQIRIIGKKYNFTKEYSYQVELQNLKSQNTQVLSPKLNRFATLHEAKEHFRDLCEYKWLTRIALCEKYDDSFNLFSLLEENEEIDTNRNKVNTKRVTLCTAHQSKGLEFDNVELGNDFVTLVKDDKIVKGFSNSLIEGYNIIYVALTRAKKQVILNDEIKDFFRLYSTSEKSTRSNVPCERCGISKDVFKNIQYIGDNVQFGPYSKHIRTFEENICSLC